jgi:hypothetical protein
VKRGVEIAHKHDDDDGDDDVCNNFTIVTNESCKLTGIQFYHHLRITLLVMYVAFCFWTVNVCFRIQT